MSVLKRASDMLKYEGVKSTAWRGAKWLTSRSNPLEEVPLATVFKQDVLAVDWTQDREFKAEKPVKPGGEAPDCLGYLSSWTIQRWSPECLLVHGVPGTSRL